MQKMILFIMGLVCAAASLHAQSPTEIKPLHIGDTLPDITLNHIINYKTTSARLSDFRGKAIIIDFFATWCGSCIGILPHLNSIQNKFKNKIQVLVVDYEPKNKTQSFLNKNSIGEKISLPFITSDSILVKLFPHKLIPHEVWVSKTGQVIAITGSSYVTEKNINKLIADSPLNLPVKKDVLDFDRHKPMLENGNGGSEKDILFRSTLIRHLGLFTSGGIDINKDSTQRRDYLTNAVILALYNNTFPHSFNNRIILEVEDSSKYINDGSDPGWEKDNTYCYELITPISISNRERREIMRQDFNKYFGLNGRMEKRLVKCWALIQIKENHGLFKSKGGKLISSVNKDHTERIFQNVSLTTIVVVLNTQFICSPINPVIINETSYTGNVDIKLKVKDILKVRDIRSIPILRKDLRPYGLDLIPVERQLNTFVLSEVKK